MPSGFGARLIKNIKPEYTPEARAAELRGSVVLYLEIGPTGKVDTADVSQSLGLGLDEKAVEAVKQRHYAPQTPSEKPFEMEQSSEVRFRLDPPTPWWIHRSAFTLDAAGVREVNQLSRPTLKQYVSPPPEACPAEGGVVMVTLKITKEGRPDHVALIENTADAMSEAVLKAIPSWRFQAGFLNGKPREARATIEMRYRAAQAGAPTPAGDAAPSVAQQDGQVITKPAIVYKIEPAYTQAARRARFEGVVVILVVVDASGHAVAMRVVRKLEAGLDEKAMEAINQWRFKPGTRDGRPVSTEATVEGKFNLL